jgi:pyridoxine 5'-phosphate synthase PdxJ
MAWFRRSRQARRISHIPTWRERRAAERTSKAETALQETEQKIHEIADHVRRDLRGSG